MLIRSTPQNVLDNALRFVRQHSLNLASLQEQLASGIRLHRPSDGPAAISTALSEEIVDSQLTAYIANTNSARSHLEVSVTQLLSVKDLLVQARDVALEARQADQPDLLAAQISNIVDQVQQLANQKFDGDFLYSGTSVSRLPFAEVPASTGRANYLGARERTQVSIGFSLTADVAYSGREVFQPLDRGRPVFIGLTGAKPGSGTSNAHGYGELIIAHGTTTYEVGSGLQAGVSSADGDTLIGALGDHSIEIDDVAKTISLDGGAEIPYDGTETDLQLVGPTGELLHVDTTGIVAGFQGSVSFTSSGTLSVDGGATEVAVDFSANQTVVHGETGEVTFVDSREIRFAGVEQVEHPGTSDIFGVLRELESDLRNDRDLNGTDWQETITRRLGELDRVEDHILSVVGEQSTTLANVDNVQFHHEDLQLETRRILSEVKSADVAQVVVELQTRQTLLEATYASTVSILGLSILNFL